MKTNLRVASPSMLAMFGLLTVGCGGNIPESVRIFAAGLPARADGQYALIADQDVKKQLVLKDALLQCKIDLTDGQDEAKSAACQCNESSGEWLTDCKAWLGAHTPAEVPLAPPVSPSNDG